MNKGIQKRHLSKKNQRLPNVKVHGDSNNVVVTVSNYKKSRPNYGYILKSGGDDKNFANTEGGKDQEPDSLKATQQKTPQETKGNSKIDYAAFSSAKD